MNILTLDTSSSACSISLRFDDQSGKTSVFSHHEVAPLQQAGQVLGLIQSLMEKSSLSINQLHAIAFGCGPGSFTGLRIASSVVQGLGFSFNIPIITVSSMAAMAQAALMTHGWKNVRVIMDAHQEHVYYADYQANHENLMVLKGDEHLSLPNSLSPTSFEEYYGVGNGWEKYKSLLLNEPASNPIKIDTAIIPTGEAILLLSIGKYDRDEWVAPKDALPSYLS